MKIRRCEPGACCTRVVGRVRLQKRTATARTAAIRCGAAAVMEVMGGPFDGRTLCAACYEAHYRLGGLPWEAMDGLLGPAR